MTIPAILFEWVRLVTGLDEAHVIAANQTGPRPSGDYITIGLLTDTLEDKPVKIKAPSLDEDFITASFTHLRHEVYTINAYANSGVDYLAALYVSRGLWGPRVLLKSEGFVLRSKTSTRDVTAFEDTRFRQRTVSDFEFVRYYSQSEEVERISTYELEGTIE